MRICGSNRKVSSVFVFFMTICFWANTGVVFGANITVMPDISLFVQIFNFIFLILVLNYILYKPIRKILAQRKEKIAGLEHKIETLDTDARERDEAYAEGIKDARVKGFKEKEALVNAASEEEKAIIEKINQKAQAELAEMREKIAKDAETARAALQKEIDGFANAIGEKILGRAV